MLSPFSLVKYKVFPNRVDAVKFSVQSCGLVSIICGTIKSDNTSIRNSGLVTNTSPSSAVRISIIAESSGANNVQLNMLAKIKPSNYINVVECILYIE